MKVIIKTKKTKILNLRAGDVFLALDNYYMILDRYNSEKAQQLCVNIETGITSYFDYDALVLPYEAEVTLK